MPTQKRILTVFLALLMGTSAAMARPSLSADSRITNELTIAAVGDAIRNNCPTINAKMITAVSKAMQLRDYAMSLGYSGDEIQDFLGDKTEQGRIYALRDQYLSQHGVTKGDAASYCKLGEAEIAKGSLLGSILQSK